MDDLPLVAIPGLKIQELGPGVLQFEKEFEGVATGGAAAAYALSSDPLVPRLDHQTLHVLLFHSNCELLRGEIDIVLIKSLPKRFAIRRKRPANRESAARGKTAIGGLSKAATVGPLSAIKTTLVGPPNNKLGGDFLSRQRANRGTSHKNSDRRPVSNL
jgi:hypothetical protein